MKLVVSIYFCILWVLGFSLPSRSRFGSKVSLKGVSPTEKSVIVNVPLSFDLRDINGINYASTIKNQDIPNYCDASWAIASASAISDRIRYSTNAAWPLHELSSQVLINCDDNSNGCRGGSSINAYSYMFENGIPEESCMSFSGLQERCSSINICRSCTYNGDCYPVYNYRTFRVSNYGRISGEELMKREIFEHGTITCTVDVTNPFIRYRRGIFSEYTHSWLYHHVVSVVGWGHEDDTPYWIVRNSWGSYWGESGFVRILRGRNILNIESDCSWAIPSIVSNFTTPKKSVNSIKKFESCGYPTDWTLTLPVVVSPLPSSYVNISSLPSEYDIRHIRGRDLSSPNKNQHNPRFCNSCWAQATASALSDRLTLSRRGQWPLIDLSAQVLVNCAGGSCQGGDAGDAYRYAYTNGLPDRTCQAYEGEKKTCSSMSVCMDCQRDGVCHSVESYRKVFVMEYGEVQGIDNMKAEIYERGPITCFMVMTDEFTNYQSGVFVEHDHKYMGGHIVEVAGWGITGHGQKYWIVRNNWGDYWGEHGWFRINMGGSNLMIESACSWGVPSLV